jgi:crotonobetainyl-CoA:carnitine CoA-transferase CaiB-like acyl-CoA transferase
MLSDMGADVIKIESDGGETMRTRPPVRRNCSAVFGGLNVGKKSVVLDLKSAKGVDAIRKLAAKADILVENFRPGVMRRLKLDCGSLRELNPKLIYCSISGYGQTGPSAELPAYAPVIHAASGYDMAHLAYQPGRQRPDYCGIYHADILTGVYAFGAISAALYQRHRTGQGQHIDVSMLESMLSLTLNEVQGAQFAIKPPQRPMFGPMETSDGYVMVAIASEKTFQNLVTVAGRAEFIRDPRFAAYADRRDHWGDLMEGVEAWSRMLTSQQCLTELNGAGVPCSAYRSVAEAMADPQIAHRGALAQVADGGGTFNVMNMPFRMSGAEVSAGPRVAEVGEHTEEVLKEIGMVDTEVASAAAK